MIGKIIHAHDTVGLISYLVGPGHANEHVRQRVVAGSDWVKQAWQRPEGDFEWSRSDRLSLADYLDENYRTWAAVAKDQSFSQESRSAARRSPEDESHLFHYVLSLDPRDAAPSDEQWEKIAHRYMELMETDGCRWVAVNHGVTKNEGQHIHIAMCRVKENGQWYFLKGDFRRSREACRTIEQEFGLHALKDRSREYGMPGYTQAEARRAAQVKDFEPARVKIARRVRACAVASMSEADFVAGLKRAGLLVLPRFAQGGDRQVVGYSVALRPRKGERVWWYSASKFDPSLTLGKLRQGWSMGTPNEAVAAWGGTPWSAEVEVSAQPRQQDRDWSKKSSQGLWRERQERAQRAQVSDRELRALAGDLGGLLGLSADQFSGGLGERLARAARQCAIAAQPQKNDSGSFDPTSRVNIAATARIMAAASSQHDLAGWLAVIEQMGRLADSLREAQLARQELVAAQRTHDMVCQGLGAVRADLQQQLHGGTGLSASDAQTAARIRGVAQAATALPTRRPDGTQTTTQQPARRPLSHDPAYTSRRNR